MGKCGVANDCSIVAHPLDEVLAMMARIAGHAVGAQSNREFMRARRVAPDVGGNAKLGGPGVRLSNPLVETLA
jgi:hypothetical protein